MNNISELKKWLEEYHEYCYNNSQSKHFINDEFVLTKKSIEYSAKAEVIAHIINHITENFK